MAIFYSYVSHYQRVPALRDETLNAPGGWSPEVTLKGTEFHRCAQCGDLVKFW